MKVRTRESGWGVLVLFFAGITLLVLMTGAAQFRSPGTVNDMWGICVLGVLVLLGASWWMLVWLREGPIWARVVVYVSAGIVVGVGIMLGLIFHEQDEYDRWAHRGISYSCLEGPVPHANRRIS